LVPQVRGNITYSEDPGVKIGNIATNGTASVTSPASAGIVEDLSGHSDDVNVAGTNARSRSRAEWQHQSRQSHWRGLARRVLSSPHDDASGSAALYTTALGNVALGAVNANSLVISYANAKHHPDRCVEHLRYGELHGR